MPDGKHIVVFDGNGTVRDTRPAKREILAELLGVQLPQNIPATRAVYAQLHEDLGTAYDYVSQHLHEFPQFITHTKPVPGALEAARQMRDEGFTLYLCMNRTAEEAAAFKDWLVHIDAYRYSGQPLFTDVIGTGGRSKGQTLRPLGRLDAIVDDTYEKIADVDARHKYVIGTTQGLPPGVRGFKEWGERGHAVGKDIVREVYGAPVARWTRKHEPYLTGSLVSRTA